MIALRMGATQAAAVDVYCLDDAHGGEFAGRVSGFVLEFEAVDRLRVWDWLIDVANTLDDESCDSSRGADDRACSRRWGVAIMALAERVSKAPSVK